MELKSCGKKIFIFILSYRLKNECQQENLGENHGKKLIKVNKSERNILEHWNLSTYQHLSYTMSWISGNYEFFEEKKNLVLSPIQA